MSHGRISLVILVFPFLLFSQTRTKSDFRGNYFFEDDELTSLIRGIEPDVKSDSIVFIIKRVYYDNGFLDCTVQPQYEIAEDSSHTLILLINEGERYRTGDILFPEPDSSWKDEAVTFRKNLTGIYFSSSLINSGISSLLKYFEDNGNPFAKITLDAIIKDTVSYLVDISISIEPGKTYYIDKIVVKGNENTNENVIFRELDIARGDRFSEAKINEIPSQLNRLKFFDPVQLPEFYIDSKEKGTLEITVTERNVNNFDGIVGYIPPAEKEKTGYVTGLVTISLKNLFGTGRASSVRWQKIDRLSSELEFAYFEPRLFGYRVNVGGSFFQKKQDSVYVLQKMEGYAEFPITSSIFFSFIYTRETVIPTVLTTPAFTVYNSLLNSYSAGLRIDTRDDPLSPTSGIFFNNTFGNAEKRLRGPAEYILPGAQTIFSLKKVNLSLNLVYSIFIRQVLFFGLNGKTISGEMLEMSDLYKLGGARSLRGYRENQFFGSVIGWSNIEYRVLMGRRSYGFLFFDTGYYKRNVNTTLKISGAEDTKMGYGLGLNLETGVGVLNVSYALAKGDNFSQGKIHFGIINDF